MKIPTEQFDMSEEEAKKLYDEEFWKPLSHRERATFQLYSKRLCMPFDVFHEAVEKALGRSVWTHEFALNYSGLIKELNGEAEPPSFQEIVELIPEEKRIILCVPED